MLFRPFGRPEGQPHDPHLYDVVATAEGIRVSPTCHDGHVLVMELIEKLGLAERMQTRAVPMPQPGAADRGFLIQHGSGSPPIVVAMTGPGAGTRTVQARGHSGEPRSRPTPELSGPTPALLPATGSQPANASTVAPLLNTEVIPTAAPVDAPASGDLLSTLIERHLRNVALGPKRATPATRDRAYALNLLIETLGDRPIDRITPDDALRFAALLAQWPARRQTYPQLDGLTAPNVAARAKREKLPTIRPGTQHKHIMHVNALMNWALKLGALTENPFKYVDTARYLRDETGRRRKKKDIFNHADLAAMFDPALLASYTSPHKFWVPLIAYHTGMRVNEVTQLYVADVRTDPYLDESGQERLVMTFDITGDRDGQSVKTEYAVRRIPVPQRILDLGFERYLADVRASGASHLFPGLSWAEGGPGRVVSQWVNDIVLRKVCQITDRRKSLHSLRHTLTTLMDRNKIPESIICAINGHTPGTTVDKRNYVADGTVLEMRRVLDTLPFPDLPLAPYVSGQFKSYLSHAASEREREERAKQDGVPFKRPLGRRPNEPRSELPTSEEPEPRRKLDLDAPASTAIT
jgi:integrase